MSEYEFVEFVDDYFLRQRSDGIWLVEHPEDFTIICESEQEAVTTAVTQVRKNKRGRVWKCGAKWEQITFQLKCPDKEELT
jgi:hypothetical protein